MTTRRPRRPPTQTQRPTTTSSRGAVTKSPSVVRPRACTTPTRNNCARIPSTILQRVGAVGIDAETARRILDALKADAKASKSGKANTARVLAKLEAMMVSVNGAAIRILAGAFSIGLERVVDPSKDKGGRPEGARDRRPRKPRADRPSRRDEVCRARAEHPEWTMDQIGEALGMTKQAVSYHLKKVKPAPSDG